MTDDGLTAGAVARRLGVAVTTLRTWHQRYGLGPSEHVPGHHRRYTAEDLDRLQVMRPGHLGAQRFFTAAGRPFCLYAVVTPARRRPAQLIGELGAVLATVRFDA